MLLMTETVMSLADIAQELGVSRQAIKNRMDRGTLPKPDYKTVRGAPLWKRSTLKKAEVIGTR